MNDDYLKSQIITYMGNKRKLLPHIEKIVLDLQDKIGRKLNIGDGFSGSGIVSRLFKLHANKLYVNDISSYSETLNKCFLSNITNDDAEKIKEFIKKANEYADKQNKYNDHYISGNWSPNGKIKENDRVYFTEENGKRIDVIRNYIETIPKKYRPFLLAMLLVEASIHNNTSGQFSAFYKNGKIGQYGGSKNIDLKRITDPITLKMPHYVNNKCETFVYKEDTNDWVKNIPKLDVVYYDPPYNKHPYSIYYFLLNIINDWDKNIEIPNTTRGQPLNWDKSLYNSSIHAIKAFEELIMNTNSQYILISYNNGGIIPICDLEKILKKYGSLEKINVEHKTYNKMKGISNYKRTLEKDKIQEFFFLLHKNV